MNIRTTSIFITAASIILISVASAATATVTSQRIEQELLEQETVPMCPEERNVFIQARYCYETGHYKSAVLCLKKLKAMKRVR